MGRKLTGKHGKARVTETPLSESLPHERGDKYHVERSCVTFTDKATGRTCRIYASVLGYQIGIGTIDYSTIYLTERDARDAISERNQRFCKKNEV